jgi:hypothetical protein
MNKPWQNRIVSTGEKPASEFKFNPSNWRLHGDNQRSAIDGILSEIGWVTGVIENVRTGNLIDGHLRIEEALQKDENTPVPFTQVDLSDEEERKILMLLDPIGSLATMDSEAFAALAESTNLMTDSLTKLIADLSNENLVVADDEPNLNDPNFKYENKFGVIVECDDEKHQKKVFDYLVAQGYKVKVVVV